MNIEPILRKLASRKFLLGMAGLIIAVLNDPIGLNLTGQAQAELAASPALAIMAQGLVDMVEKLKGVSSKK
jgi:hypothetical protein